MGAESRDAVARKVDIRLPGKGNSNSHGARPVHLIITMIKWIRTGTSAWVWYCQKSGAKAIRPAGRRAREEETFSPRDANHLPHYGNS